LIQNFVNEIELKEIEKGWMNKLKFEGRQLYQGVSPNECRCQVGCCKVS